LINRNSGKAVEVEGLSTADGARVRQWSDWGGANQQWQLVRLSGTTPSPGMAPQQVVAAMQPGWNLGNSLDATGSDETSWGNPRVTEALLDNIKAQGFKSIRIPVTWSQHQGGAPNYTIDSAWMSRVREIVDWAIARDLYVLINVHHDSWQWIWNMPSQHDTVLARFNATWTQIASTFRDHSNRLLFESVNEPQFTGSSGDTQEYQLLNELNVSFRAIVRQSGGTNATRVLVLPTLHTDSGQARVDALVNTINQMGDPNVAAAIPTQFRGDQLATMEATYADGSNAGPNNWTSFKEFDVTLAPDYPANRILLRPAFFAEVNDGAIVTLTFHFWSGARVTYRLVKNGGNVTGTA
jgi:aryl-phospho-beta-D-glucosidase BglC (GH1 family)